MALSDRGLLGPAQSGLLDQGLFVMELSLPLQGGTVLLSHQAEDGWFRTFAVFHDLAAGLIIMHRQGKVLRRHVLPGPLPQGRGTGRLTFEFDAPARQWAMSFEVLSNDQPNRISVQGINPLPMQLSDIQALCTQAREDGPVLWFGLTKGREPPRTAPWIGLRTPVATSIGPVAAGNLQAGAIIMTQDHGPLPLLGLRRFDLPSRGSFAPVLLRSPFFGQNQDLLVSADQLIAISGAETEYLFGEDCVLMRAGDLVDGRTALRDQRRAVTVSVELDLGRPAVFDANGCQLASGFGSEDLDQPMRQLHSYEVLTLMALLGRTSRRSA